MRISHSLQRFHVAEGVPLNFDIVILPAEDVDVLLEFRSSASSSPLSIRVRLTSPARQQVEAMSPLACCSEDVLVYAWLVVVAIGIAIGAELDQVAYSLP
jgi:hypothetical protein